MARLRGRAPRGERLVGKVPHGHWKTTTFVAGLRTSALTAPCVIDGPMNGNAFLAYIEQILAPSLIPSPTDQNPWAHWRNPMDMMRQG